MFIVLVSNVYRRNNSVVLIEKQARVQLKTEDWKGESDNLRVNLSEGVLRVLHVAQRHAQLQGLVVNGERVPFVLIERRICRPV
jgi:hypothetical protein